MFSCLLFSFSSNFTDHNGVLVLDRWWIFQSKGTPPSNANAKRLSYRATAFVWPPIVFHHIREILRYVFLFLLLFVVGGVEKGSKKVKLESQIQVLLNAKRTELKWLIIQTSWSWARPHSGSSLVRTHSFTFSCKLAWLTWSYDLVPWKVSLCRSIHWEMANIEAVKCLEGLQRCV